MSMHSLVTVKTFTYAHEAAVAKGLLTSEGIFCFLKDELTIQAQPFYSNALGGVKLQVGEADAAVAIDILNQQGGADNTARQTIAIKTSTGEIAECPVCGSDELSRIKKPSKALWAEPVVAWPAAYLFFERLSLLQLRAGYQGVAAIIRLHFLPLPNASSGNGYRTHYRFPNGFMPGIMPGIPIPPPFILFICPSSASSGQTVS